MLQTFASKVTFISSGTRFCVVITRIRYLFIFIFNFWTLRMKIWLNQGLWLVSRSCLISNIMKLWIFIIINSGLELGIWNSRCQSLCSKFSKFMGATQHYVVKLPKSAGARHYYSKIPRVPGTLGTRAKSSPDKRLPTTWNRLS